MLEIIPVETAADSSDLFIIFVGRDVITSLHQPMEPFWPRSEVERSFGGPQGELPIGRWGGQSVYVAQVDGGAIDPLAHIQGSLYTLIGRVPDAVFDAYGRGLQMLTWRRDHRFCGRCGQPTTPADGGRAMRCEACDHSSYPKLAPCVIVAVSDGDRLLLAAARGNNRRFYSTLAGFVEPGESCEQAVVREVMEETGIEVGDVRYFGSQPWPFPGQLMLGFHARRVGGELQIDETELEDADWYHQDALPPVPPPATIAGQLIRSFFSH